MPERLLADRGKIYFLDPNPTGWIPILLLHGLGVTGESWALQFPTLCQLGFRPLAPDIPGFGKSINHRKGWSVRGISETLVSFIREMGFLKVHIVGISMGGVLAQQIAFEYPEIVDRLVLVNTFTRLLPMSFSGWLYFARRFFEFNFRGLRKQAEFVAARLFPQPGQEELRRIMVDLVMQSDLRAYRRAMIALSLFNSTKHLGDIHQPTLVVTGERDTTVPFQNQKVLAQSINGAQHVIISNAGHAVTIDQPDLFNTALVKFLLNQAN